jgi:drug/metabolite transporter (DMT)-like permease
MNNRISYLVLMHLIIFMWGFTGIIGKLIHLDAFTLVWARILIAIVSLGIVLIFLKYPMKIERNGAKSWVFFGGIFVALHWITFYYAIQLSTASLAILCLSTATVHVTWLEPLLFQTKFSFPQLGIALLIVVGIGLVSQDLDFKELEALIFGLISALFAALFSVINAKVSLEVKTPVLAFYEFCIGFLLVSCMIPILSHFDLRLFYLPGDELAWLLFLGLGCTTFAFLMTIEIVKVIGVFTVSLSINLEPVYTILLAAYMLEEGKYLNKSFYIGTVVILFAVTINALYKNYFMRSDKKVNQGSA